MSADKGAKSGLLELLVALNEAGAITLNWMKEEEEGVNHQRPSDELEQFTEVVRAFNSREPFAVEYLKPQTFGQFLALDNPTQGQFRQMASEVPWWKLLNQIEEACLLGRQATAKARSFIEELWVDEVSKGETFRPPANWRYLPTEEAVEAWKKIFGSSIRVNGLLDAANKKFKPWQHSEGVGVWPSLWFLFDFFEIPRELGISEKVDPTGVNEDALASYAKIVDLLLCELGKIYQKATGFAFRNYRESRLSSNHLQLTAGGR